MCRLMTVGVVSDGDGDWRRIKDESTAAGTASKSSGGQVYLTSTGWSDRKIPPSLQAGMSGIHPDLLQQHHTTTATADNNDKSSQRAQTFAKAQQSHTYVLFDPSLVLPSRSDLHHFFKLLCACEEMTQSVKCCLHLAMVKNRCPDLDPSQNQSISSHLISSHQPLFHLMASSWTPSLLSHLLASSSTSLLSLVLVSTPLRDISGSPAAEQVMDSGSLRAARVQSDRNNSL